MSPLLVAVCLLAQPRGSGGPNEAQNAIDFFENRIRPLLVEKCYGCHSAKEGKEPKGGLRLDSREGWAKGGDSGPAIVPGEPAESLLLRAVSYEDPDLSMPPKGKLSAREIADLERWIAMGAPDPRSAGAEGAGRAQPPGDLDGLELAKRRAAHWAWQAITPRDPPAVSDQRWPRCPLDRFILARLEAAGLRPAPEAERRTWLRRLSFDLTGLPPAPGEVEAFVADGAPGAWERAADRLLASPHFGEHWGQHWLDLVRYAETRGHEQDFPIPEAWRFRDYVIRAFNADVPYDAFVVEHIAGDLLAAPRVDPHTRTNESIQGTGFWHLGEATHSPVDIRGEEADRVANQIDVFSKTFLGLSAGCARCHDHKFDAISTEDYYALCGYLQSSSYQLADVSDPAAKEQAFEELAELRAECIPKLLRAYAAVTRARSAKLGAYLLAAAEVLGAGEATTVAASRGLEPARLGRWVEILKAAAGHLDDPLHPLAAVAAAATSPGGLAGASAAAPSRGVLEAWEREARESAARIAALRVVRTVEDGERKYVRTARAREPADTVVDYAAPGPEDWITGGHRFGARPARAGEAVLGSSPERPIARLVEEAAAESDLLSGKLSGMLRTRTFEVTSDTLWYRFRGKADLFLAVDSHRVVAGPLHGVVKQTLDAPGDWRWQAHKVADYIGHRVHVEFTPRGDFSLVRVQFAAEAPPERYHPNGRLVEVLEAAAGLTVAGLAERLAGAFLQAVEELARGEPAEADGERDRARLVNWLLEHEDLLEPAGEAGERLAATFRRYAARKAAIEARIPAPVRALAMLDGSGEDEFVHIRGNHRNLAPSPVPRRPLEALGGLDSPRPQRGSGRLELAWHLIDPARNPLLARVMVNRLWHHLLGRGIVETADDFGVMGKPPSHPELLDDLAARFIARGWSVKAMIREIVLSSTYRMSSRPLDPGLARAADPANIRLHHGPLKRLPAESVRDAILAVSGALERRLHGPSIRVHITPYMRNNRSPDWSGPLDGDRRRSIYIEVRRNHLSPVLVAFDKPLPFTTFGRRQVSNSPAQPLTLMNDPFVHQQARRWAEEVLHAVPEGDGPRIRRLYLAAFARPPAPGEEELAREFLAAQRGQYETYGKEGEALAWTDLCHTLVNVKEFIFLP